MEHNTYNRVRNKANSSFIVGIAVGGSECAIEDRHKLHVNIYLFIYVQVIYHHGPIRGGKDDAAVPHVSLSLHSSGLFLSFQNPLVDDSLSKEDKYLARAEKLMKQTPMIDGHNVYSFEGLLTRRTYRCYSAS